MKNLSFDEIIAADDLPRYPVEIPEWGGQVHVRVLRADERGQIEERWAGKAGSDPNGFRQDILQRTVVNEEGQKLIPPDRMNELFGKSAAAVETLVDKAIDVNKLGGTGDVEETAKN